MRRFYFLAAVVFAFGATFAAQAQQPTDPLYAGIKAGLMDVDKGGFDEASNFGLLVGYELTRDPNGSFFAEGEYTRSFSDGDVRIAGQRGEWDAETLGGYLGYRTAGPWFLKAKAGLVWQDVTVSGIGGRNPGSDTNFSVGAGGGARLSDDVALELEYSWLGDDLAFISLGIITHF